MVIEQRAVGGVTVLDLNGKLALGDGDGLLRDKVHSLVFQGLKEIALNLGGLSYMDSAGLGELISVHSTATRAGGHIKIFNLTKRVNDLLAITKVLTVFDVFDSEQEALKSFPAVADSTPR
jgi:anti-sigma B factor antagonist